MKLPLGIIKTVSSAEFRLALHARAAGWAAESRAEKQHERARYWAARAREAYAEYLALKEAGL